MENNKRRAVAYCRVSTDKAEQKTSIETQRINAIAECETHNWELPKINRENLCIDGIYYDVGTSGTKLKRPAFDRLLLDAGLTPVVDADTDQKTTTYKIVKKPLFNIIVVKNASRFSRNVSINEIMHRLKDNGVYVFFSDLNMTTEINEHWSIIQQFFIFAENESRLKSTAVAKGYETGVKQGKIYFGGKMIGYDYDKKNNRLVKNKEEARLVQRVFDLYTEEKIGMQRICNALADEGFYTVNKKGERIKYGRSTIKRMLQNEKYCGITNSGRYHKVDLFSSNKIIRDYNDDLRVKAREAQENLKAQGIIKIEPIITVEQFKKAQEICKHNDEVYKCTHERLGVTDYSKKVVCGCCGAYYRASGRRLYAKYKDYKTLDKYKDGKISRYVCTHSIVYDEANGIPKCTNKSILEPELDKALFGRDYWIRRRINIDELINEGSYYITVLQKAINSDNEQAIAEIDNNIRDLESERVRISKLYVKGKIPEKELDTMDDEVKSQIDELKAKKKQLSKGNDEIYKDIEIVKELITEAKAEQKTVENILETKEYPKKTRLEMLRDVEKITIDADGKPKIMFRSLENIKTTILNMGIMIETYAELEEVGWEEEVKQAFAEIGTTEEEYLKKHENQDHKTVNEIITDIEKHGGKVLGKGKNKGK